MTPLLFVLAAAAGAVLRLLAGLVVCSWRALLFVNSAGAALLGWAVTADVSPATLTVVGVGFCGALTNYSSFAVDARSLGWRNGAMYTASTILCVCGAASIGSSFA